MINNSKQESANTIYAGFIFLLLLCFGFMIAEIINNRFWLSDFEVYYKAAQRISASDNLYRHAEDGHYVFKYSPTSAILFIPFTIFQFTSAKYIYWTLLSFIIGSGFYLCIKLLQPNYLLNKEKKIVNGIIFLAILILALHFLRELHLGQVNNLLLFIYIMAIYFHQKDKWLIAVILLSVSVFIKPFAFIFIPYFLIKKNYREVFSFFAATILLAVLPFLFYDSSEIAMAQYQQWFHELKIELSLKQGLLSDANHTIFSVLARYSPIKFFVTTPFRTLMYQGILLLLIGLFVLYFIRITSKIKSSVQEKYYTIMDFILLISLIPLLAFTSENAFIYTQLLVFVILIYFKKLVIHEKIIAIVGFLFIGGNFAEIIGKKLSQTIDNISLVSFGTILLIYLLFVLKKKDLLRIEVVK